MIWMKILKEPWDFYFKIQTRNTNETCLLLELQKQWILAYFLMLAEILERRKDESIFASLFDV